MASLRMNQHLVSDQPGSIRRHLVGEGRRRSSRVRRVLVAVPRTCHAPIDDSPFSKWTVLVPADIGDRRHFAVIAEDRDTLAAEGYHLRAFFRNVMYSANFAETTPLSSSNSLVDGSLLGARQKMRRSHQYEAYAKQHGQNDIAIGLQRA